MQVQLDQGDSKVLSPLCGLVKIQYAFFCFFVWRNPSNLSFFSRGPLILQIEVGPVGAMKILLAEFPEQVEEQDPAQWPLGSSVEPLCHTIVCLAHSWPPTQLRLAEELEASDGGEMYADEGLGGCDCHGYNILQPQTTMYFYLEQISKKRADFLGRDLNPELGT